jgi:hypothetical protein
MAELTKLMMVLSAGLLPLKPFKSSFYGTSTTKKSWDAARTTCQNLGGDLAALEDDSEWNQFYSEGEFQDQAENLWYLKY